jgi:hypothetical protein
MEATLSVFPAFNIPIVPPIPDYNRRHVARTLTGGGRPPRRYT